MDKETLSQLADELYKTRIRIKLLSEDEASLVRHILTYIQPEGVEISGNIICKRNIENVPEIDNAKLYDQLAFQEICAYTRPLLGELEKGLGELVAREMVASATVKIKQDVSLVFEECHNG
jgi:hypothetical protein